MVLKKTNTVLNSGGTQRVTNCHVFRQRGNHLSLLERNQITWCLRPPTHVFIPQSSPPLPYPRHLLDILEFFADDFGCEELPSLAMVEKDRTSRMYTTPTSTIMLSMNKKKRWLLPKLIEEFVLGLNTNTSTSDMTRLSSYPATLLPPGLRDLLGRVGIAIHDRNASATHPNTIKSSYVSVVAQDIDIDHDAENSDNNNNNIDLTEQSQCSRKARATKDQNDACKKCRSKKRKKKSRKSCDDEENQTTLESVVDRSSLPGNYNYNRIFARPGLYTQEACLHIDIVRDVKDDARAATVKTQLKRWQIRPYNAPRVALCKGKHSIKGLRYGPLLAHTTKKTTTHAALKEALEEADVLFTPTTSGRGRQRLELSRDASGSNVGLIHFSSYPHHYDGTQNDDTDNNIQGHYDYNTRHPITLQDFIIDTSIK